MKRRGFMTAGEAAILAVAAVTLIVWLLFPKGTGGQVVVTRSGEEVGRYSLNAPVRTPIQGANGFSLTLVVEDGQVHVEDSTCPDLICQRHAPVSRAGEAIVCLPGQVTVTVKGGEGHGSDAVSG